MYNVDITTNTTAMDPKNSQPQDSAADNNNNKADQSYEPRPEESGQSPVAGDPNNEKVMAILAYLGVLVIIPILVAKDSDFVMYHANQGLVLFIAEIILFAIGIVPILGWLISFLGYIGAMVLAIMGIINAVNKKKKPLPLIGGYQLLE